MPEIVSETRDVDHIGIAAQRLAEFASDLGDLEGVSQAGTREVRLAGHHDLGLGSQAAKSCGVKNPGTISREIASH